mgnify:CR=1 FL=1
MYFNPRAPCGARHDFKSKATGEKNFNPRAPCGARRGEVKKKQRCLLFQPTRPLRGATCCLLRLPHRQAISTHAPLAGRDPCRIPVDHPAHAFQPTRPLRGATSSRSPSECQYRDFNPRAPCGARRNLIKRVLWRWIFQPTRPLRGATIFGYFPYKFTEFQPTRPLRGATTRIKFCLRKLLQFQPTRPLRGATPLGGTVLSRLSISTHAPLAGRDR